MNNQRGGISYFDRDVIGVEGFTWNPTTGCTFGCPECWARGVAQTRLAPAWEQKAIKSGAVIVGGADFDKFSAYRTFTPTLHPERLDEPARRKKPAVIGVCFMGDLFDPALSDVDFWQIPVAMMCAPQHTYVLLTKRPELMAIAMGDNFKDGPRPNWYLGFSARNQAEFDAGWPHMAKLAAAGWKVWVSLEPMQSGMMLQKALNFSFKNGEQVQTDAPKLSGVIVGAQSGKNAVPFNLDWARSIQMQCGVPEIPFMFKQDNSTGKVVTLPELDGKRHAATAWIK